VGVALLWKFRHGRLYQSNFKSMTAFLFSCENATCAVPEAYREIFRGSEEVVASAEGWEPGSLSLAQAFAMRFRTPLVHGDVTRLLIDFEKDGDERWSRFSMKLPEATRIKVADRHERPFRALLRQRIAEDLRRYSRVLHVMIHADAETDGLVTLGTPEGAVLAEKIAAAWRARMVAEDLDIRVAPIVADQALGLGLSQEFPAEQYARIRLGVSQTFFLEGRPWRWEKLKKLLLDSLAQAAEDIHPVSDPESPSIDQC
jgi:hypothetical protein